MYYIAPSKTLFLAKVPKTDHLTKNFSNNNLAKNLSKITDCTTEKY